MFLNNLLVLGFWIGWAAAALGYTNLTEAYTAAGFDPRAPGNAVVVYFSDPHMSVDTNGVPAPIEVTNLEAQLVQIVNEMDPPPAKIIIAGDVTSSFAAIPGSDATKDLPTYRMATNEMRYFREAIKALTNIAQTNIVWIPGNHDQGAFETNAETFRLMFPNMPTYQTFKVAGLPFFLVNAGNFGDPGEAQLEWLKREAAKVPKNEPVVAVTHQPPFTGVVVHRGTPRMLREVFGDWESRWWMLDGHEHSFGYEVYDVGRSNVAQVTVGPAGTNTFVGYTIDCGLMVLCVSNDIQHIIYHRYRTKSYDVLPEPDWQSPKKYRAAFEEVPGLVWRRLKSVERAPEVVAVEANDSINWWAYTTLLELELPLARHLNEATHFLVLAAGLDPSSVFECSVDRSNWVTMEVSGEINHVYQYPLPPEVAASSTAWVRYRAASVRNNWIGGWGLATTNGTPKITFPRIEEIPPQTAAAGSVFTLRINAVSPYSPPDKLRFSIVEGPAGASIDRNTGQFTWRPPIAQAPSTQRFRIRVEDTGTPVFGAEQDLWIATERAAGPKLEFDSSSGFGLLVVADAGNYELSASDDGERWELLCVTNPPDIHLKFTDAEPLGSRRLYRVSQEPSSPALEVIPGDGSGGNKLRVNSNSGILSVQVSEDLMDWKTVLRTNVGPVQFEVQDPQNPANPARKYRVVETISGQTN